MNRTILLCTVGGSHQPVLEAIQSVNPKFVCFFCTGRDPESDQPGSVSRVAGTGSVIRAHCPDQKVTLSNIPTQASLNQEQYEVVEVPADNLEEAYGLMHMAISKLSRRYSRCRFVADYTGGTKTMTAALVCAALRSEEVELQLVSGARPDLSHVRQGTEQAMTASTEYLRLDRGLSRCLSAWSRFAYRDAATGLRTIRIDAGSLFRQRLGLARTLSEMLALWDDFDHSGALQRARAHRKLVATSLPGTLQTLDLLVNSKNPRSEPARLFDLLLNAQRRASQGRFDDAVARVYRLIEWTAQWQLRRRLDVSTANFPAEMMPKGSTPRRSTDGRILIGLQQAWEVIQERVQGPVGEFANRNLNQMCDLMQLRNYSILAHGFKPVDKDDWDRLESWMNRHFIPMLSFAAKQDGLKRKPQQFPTVLPKMVLEGSMK